MCLRRPGLGIVWVFAASVAASVLIGCQSAEYRPARDARLIRAVEGDSVQVTDIAFTPDGKWIFSCGSDGLKQWNAATLELVDHQIFDFAGWGHGNTINSVAVASEKPQVYIGTYTQSVQVWDYELKRIVGTIPTRKRAFEVVPSIAISPDGKTLAIVENGAWKGVSSEVENLEFSILLWDLKASREIGRLTGHGYPVGSLVFFRDGNLLIGDVNWVWNVKTGQLLFPEDSSGESASAQTAEPHHFIDIADVTGIGGQSIDSTGGSSVASRLIDRLKDRNLLAVDRIVVIGDDEGYANVYAGDSGSLITKYQQFGNGTDVEVVAISPDGTKLATGGQGILFGGMGSIDDQSHRNLCLWRLEPH